MNSNNAIRLDIVVNATLEKAWHCWVNPADILTWNRPSDDWHTTEVEMDFQAGGRFCYRMKKKDRSVGFDHEGRYDIVIPLEQIEYTGNDGRRTTISFDSIDDKTRITETFDADPSLDLDLQRDFCMGVLTNYKNLVES